MKISFFIGSMGRGGAERVISILANSYREKGWDVDIVLLLKNNVEYELHDGIHIVDLTSTSGSYVKSAPHWLRGIRSYLKKTKPDRVVSFVGRINALVLTAAYGLKLPIVISERNDPKHDGRGKAMQWYCNRIYHKAEKIVFQNEHERSCFDRTLAGKSCIIPNPVQVAAVREQEQSLTVVTAGRLIEQKNQKILVSAMAQLRQQYPQIKCRIYGEGVLRQPLQEQIKALGCDSTVTLEGNVADIHKRLTQCGIFVLCSNFEGLSNALIEAMMVGLPCITTDYPGARELIEDGKTGIVVPMDDAEQLAQAIKALLDDPEKRRQLATAGQQYAQAFRAETVLQAWTEVIETAD